jgi:hypothetical protein
MYVEYMIELNTFLYLVYQQIPQNFYQSNIEVFAARTRRSADSNGNQTNGSIYHDLSKDPILPPLIESGMFHSFPLNLIVFFLFFSYSQSQSRCSHFIIVFIIS